MRPNYTRSGWSSSASQSHRGACQSHRRCNHGSNPARGCSRCPVFGSGNKGIHASSTQEIDAVFADLARERADALYLGGDTFLHSPRHQIATLAALHGLPAAYPQREWAEAGG